MMEKRSGIGFFVVDLDRTLDGEYEACRTALASLRKGAPVRTALATAHGAWTPKALSIGAYYDLDYLVLENGSVILERNDEGWQELSEWKNRHGDARVAVADFRKAFFARTQSEDAVSSKSLWPPFLRSNIVLPGTGSSVELQAMSVVLIVKACDPGSFPGLRNFVESILRELPGEVALIWDGAAVTVGVADKGDAMDFLARHRVPRRLRTAAMGDSFNDLGMLSRCDVPCAPANAHEPVKALVKQRGGIVAGGERWEGVEEVLRQLQEVEP